MVDEQKIRLTDNQRRLLNQAMGRFDKMLWELIDRAKDADGMVRPEEKLSSNGDFRKMALAYHVRFEEHLKKNNLTIPIFIQASQEALYHLHQIVPGQSRNYVRQNLNEYRCCLLHRMERDSVNVNYACNGRHPAIYPDTHPASV
jgi:hypothetical protein